MKKLSILLVVLLAVVAVNTKNVNAQVIEVSASGVYGVFTGDFVSGIYSNFTGFDLSATRSDNTGSFGYGLFVKNIMAKDGDPYLYGISESDAGASCELKMFTWGPELVWSGIDGFRTYMRLGLLTLDEVLNTSFGDVDGTVNGITLDLGARYAMDFGGGFQGFAKMEYSIVSIADQDEAKFNNISVGAGVSMRF